MHTLPEKVTTTLATLSAFCATRGVAAWLVGGAARDIALGRIPTDLDVAVAGDGTLLARQFADQLEAAFVPLKDERGVGRVVTRPLDPDGERLVIDLSRLQGESLLDDLHRRDFTINALALPLMLFADPTGTQINAQAFIDPCNGLADITSHTLRLCSPTSLSDDPLRILRAIRLAATMDLHITAELDAAIRHWHELVTRPAAERIRDELLKLLSTPSATPWLRYMDEVGVLTRLFPELEPARACTQPIVHFLPVLAHSLEAVSCAEWLLAGLQPTATDNPTTRPAAVQAYPDLPRTLPYTVRWREHMAGTCGTGFPRTALFKLAVLLHDNAKPATKQPKPDGGVSFYGHQQIGAEAATKIGRRLHLSRAATEYVTLVVREHMRPGQLRSAEGVTPRAIVRFFRDTDNAGSDVLLHGLADHMATRGPWIDPVDWHHHIAWTGTLLDMLWGAPPEREHPLVDGHMLMQALGIEPGKLVGILLHDIREAQIAGEIHSPDEALALARQIVSSRALD